MKPQSMYYWLNLVAAMISSQGAFSVSAQTVVQAWVQRYSLTGSGASAATAMGLDTNGNVFVTGYSWNGSNYDFATLKYSDGGTPLWTNRYGGPGNLDRIPTALAVSPSGNVFVTGYSNVPPPSPAAHATDSRYVTVAYASDGLPLWTNSYSAGGNARSVAIAIGQSGNVFVTGNSAESTNSYSYPSMTTIAYSGAGVPLWTNRYEGGGRGKPSAATSLALDNQGNVFVAGYSYGPDDYQHYAVVAYSAVGVPLWTNQYIGPANFGDVAASVAADRSGNVFVAGTSYDTNGFSDYLTVAYSGAGVPLWTNHYSSGNSSQATAMAVDSTGDVFVTGLSWSGVGFPDYATVAYSAAGSALWTNRHGAADWIDAATAIAVDVQACVFVTGYSGPGLNSDYATIGYSSSGAPLWTNRYNGPGNGYDQAAAIGVDAGGNVFVTGQSWNGANYEFATIKYSVVQPIPIIARQLGSRIILSWTNSLFKLQSAPLLSATFTNVPNAVSPYTNQIGGQRFFRLIAN